jgi:hypothetical protein
MNYVDEIAAALRERLPDDQWPDDGPEELARVYALLALVKGEETTLEDVHDAWAVWKAARDPGHESLRPFAELDEETRSWDEPYAEAIRAVAAGRH